MTLTRLLVGVLVVVDDLFEQGLEPLEKTSVVVGEVFFISADTGAVGAAGAISTIGTAFVIGVGAVVVAIRIHFLNVHVVVPRVIGYVGT